MEGDRDEGVDGDDEDDDLGTAGDVVVCEAAALVVTEAGVFVDIEAVEEGRTEEVLFDDEEENQDDGEDKAREGRESAEMGQREVEQVLVFMMMDMRLGGGNRDSDVESHPSVGSVLIYERLGRVAGERL